MKKYNITVNGTTYEVIVEEVDNVDSVATCTSPAVPAPTPKATPKISTPAANGSTPITAPMPGTILDVKVSLGQSIRKGDVICVLEAMKMENDICAPADGKVVAVSVEKGQSVVVDEVLVTLA